MEKFQIPEGIRGKQPAGACPSPCCDLKQHLEHQREYLNSLPGKLTGYDCPLCLNRGVIYHVQEGALVAADCSCREIREGLRREAQSGLGDLLKRHTFPSYQTPQPWQKRAKELAQQYAAAPQGWFVAAGVSGSGKTHLCTAICGELHKQGRAVIYRTWRETARQLKAAALDGEERARLLRPLLEADVLYIDDFLKTAGGRAPSPADVELALDILGPRYNRQAVTLLSTELSMEGILNLDQALGSRIFEMTGAGSRFLEVQAGPERNWRLRRQEGGAKP